MNKIRYFWKIKTIETLGHAYAYMYAHACLSFAYACLMHVYAYTSMHMHARVLETMKDKFSVLKFGI